MSLTAQDVLEKLRARNPQKVGITLVPDGALGRPVFAHAEDSMASATTGDLSAVTEPIDDEQTVHRLETAMWGLLTEIATLNQRIIKLDERITELAEAYKIPSQAYKIALDQSVPDKSFPANALRHGTVAPR